MLLLESRYRQRTVNIEARIADSRLLVVDPFYFANHHELCELAEDNYHGSKIASEVSLGYFLDLTRGLPALQGLATTLHHESKIGVAKPANQRKHCRKIAR